MLSTQIFICATLSHCCVRSLQELKSLDSNVLFIVSFILSNGLWKIIALFGTGRSSASDMLGSLANEL